MKHLSPFTSNNCVDFRLEKENDTQIFFHEHMNTINTADVNVFPFVHLNCYFSLHDIWSTLLINDLYDYSFGSVIAKLM